MSWPVRFLLVAAMLLFPPASAHAATPFTAGSGSEASVAVGSDGTGHVVWNAEGGGSAQIGYCRVTAGAEACNRTTAFTFAGAAAANEAGRPRVFTPAPNEVVIVASCWNCPDGDAANKTYRWVSDDNGTTFASAAQIGTGLATNGFGAWLDDFGGGTFVAVNANQAMAMEALPPSGAAVPFASVGYVYGPEVARVPGSDKLVAATNDLDVVQYGVYGGPATELGVNTAGNWIPALGLPAPEADNSETALNSGPNGVYLSYKSSLPGDTRIGLRRFDPLSDSFGAPAYVEGGDAIDHNGVDHPDSAQDASGRIHMVWRSLYGGGRLRYRVSDTTGSNFTAAANLATSESFVQPEVAAGPDGRGFVAWTPGTSGAIRVVPIDPTPEPAPTPPGPPSGGSDTGDGADSIVPGISAAGVANRTLTPGQGTTFRFRASEAGLAVLTFEKRFKGVKVKQKRRGKRKAKATCAPATKKRLRALRKKAGSPRAYRKLRKKRSCKGWKRIGEIRQRVQPGANSIPFNGRIAGRRLTKGQYRGRLRITDGAGLVSRTETIKFKVVAKKAKKKRARRR